MTLLLSIILAPWEFEFDTPVLHARTSTCLKEEYLIYLIRTIELDNSETPTNIINNIAAYFIYCVLEGTNIRYI